MEEGELKKTVTMLGLNDPVPAGAYDTATSHTLPVSKYCEQNSPACVGTLASVVEGIAISTQPMGKKNDKESEELRVRSTQHSMTCRASDSEPDSNSSNNTSVV